MPTPARSARDEAIIRAIVAWAEAPPPRRKWTSLAQPVTVSFAEQCQREAEETGQRYYPQRPA